MGFAMSKPNLRAELEASLKGCVSFDHSIYTHNDQVIHPSSYKLRRRGYKRNNTVSL